MAIYIVSTVARDFGYELNTELSQLSGLYTKVDSIDHALEVFKAQAVGQVPMVTYAYDVEQVKDLVLRLQEMPDLNVIVLLGEAGSAANPSLDDGCNLFSRQSQKVN